MSRLSPWRHLCLLARPVGERPQVNTNTIIDGKLDTPARNRNTVVYAVCRCVSLTLRADAKTMLHVHLSAIATDRTPRTTRWGCRQPTHTRASANATSAGPRPTQLRPDINRSKRPRGRSCGAALPRPGHKPHIRMRARSCPVATKRRLRARLRKQFEPHVGGLTSPRAWHCRRCDGLARYTAVSTHSCCAAFQWASSFLFLCCCCLG